MARPRKKAKAEVKHRKRRKAVEPRKSVKKRGKRGPGRPLGYKCSAATRAKMKKSALARWRGHHKKRKKTRR